VVSRTTRISLVPLYTDKNGVHLPGCYAGIGRLTLNQQGKGSIPFPGAVDVVVASSGFHTPTCGVCIFD
jgi:hypothetical protein